jgi:hypothetical protein
MIVDAVSFRECYPGARRYDVIQVHHSATVDEEGMRLEGTVGDAGVPDHLAFVVDSRRGT